MKNTNIKIFSFILSLVMLLVFSPISVGATEAEEEYIPVEWNLDENLEYIYGGGKRYDRYYVKGAFYGDADSVFYFKNYAYYDGSSCQVYGESAYPHIVSVKTEPGYSCIFVDDEGKEILDSFLDGTDCIYYLEMYDEMYTKIDKDIAEHLKEAYGDESADLKWINVNELGEANIYEITVHDRTETKAYQQGAVYFMPNGHLYYVCFEDLDNTHFDADGYFSYRSGSVQAYELDDEERAIIEGSVDKMERKVHKKIYEYDVIRGYCDVNGNDIDDFGFDYDDGDYIIGIKVMFIVTTVIIGIVAPAVLLVFGVVLARSKKTGKAKCWYALSVSSAVWLLSAAALLILVMV